MTLLSRLLLILALASLATQAPAGLPFAVDDKPLPSLAPMLERITPAVVNISTVSKIEVADNPLLSDPFFRRFFALPEQPRERKSHSLGSGVVVDAARGYVLTNQHVVGEADEITVTLKDGRQFEARLIGADPETDVAVLQIPAEGLTAVSIADSDRLRVGDFVVAIGNPFGLSQTVTSGIVSALGRADLGIEGYENFIQTDASINPGNSGGPLVNLRGELVGINTAILAPNGGNVGIGFAIPSNMVMAIMQQLVDHGTVKRGWFGISSQDLDARLAKALKVSLNRGVVVVEVQDDSSASRAGLQVGDVITRVNGKPVETSNQLRTALALLSIGDRVQLQVLRGERTLTLTTRLSDPYEHFQPGGSIDPRFEGALLGEVEDNSPYGRFAAIAVGRVTEGSPAWDAGLREGDVILEVNKARVTSLKQLQQIAAAAKRIYRLRIRRDNRLILLVSR